MKSLITRKSAITIALFLLFIAKTSLMGLPLTETIYSPREGAVEIFFRAEVHRVDSYYQKEIFGIGLGVLYNFSFFVRFEYVHKGFFTFKENEIGDLFLKGKFHIGDFAGNSIHPGFLLEFRFPTGKNAYSNTEWRNLALGLNEIRLGPYCRFDVVEALFFHFNLFYTFREGQGEDFYGGFYLNIFDGETWKRVFGLNPNYDDTFLSNKRLRNDYFSVSLAINTNVLYPVVPFIEAYGSFRPSKSRIDTSNVRVEAAGVNPVLLVSGGIRFFINRSTFIGLHGVYNPFQHAGFTKEIYGIEFSIQF